MALYFHSYFGSRPPQEFSLCGFHDQYDKFCDAVFQKHGIRIKKAQLERVTSKKHVPTNSEIEKIADYLKDSIRWYEAMRAYWAWGINDSSIYAKPVLHARRLEKKATRRWCVSRID